MCFCTFLKRVHFQNHSAEYQNTKMCVFLGFRPSRVPKIAKNHVFYYGFRETPRRDLQGHPWGNKGGLQPPESTPDDTRNAKNMHFTVCFARFQNVCENVAKLQKTRVVKTYGFFSPNASRGRPPVRPEGENVHFTMCC